MAFDASLKRLLPPVLCGCFLVAAAPAVRLEESDLARGIALVNEGDFAAAVVTLDAALRGLETQRGNEKERARAELYLGVAYLELDQELMARTRFREALRLEPGMRLDPEQFSPQVLRTFEAARLETTAAAGAAPGVRAASPAPRQGAGQETAERRKKSKALPFILIGGGAAVTGVVLASGSGNGSTPPAPGSTTTVPGGTTTTTTTTTTTSPPATNPPTTTAPPAPPPNPPPVTCEYDATPQPRTLPAAAGSAACQVRTGSSCQWTAELDDGEEFVTLTGGTSGPGSGNVTLQFTANTGNDTRKARIRLRNTTTPTDARCEFEQPPASGLLPAGSLVWTGALALDGGSGQVVLDGALGAFQEHMTRRSFEARPGAHRLEATVVSARGRSGTWRFDLGGSFEPGSLRPIAGDVLSVSGESIVFRLSGRPGERVAFAFRTTR